MASSTPDLHFVLFPFMAPGHMNPMLDLANLLAAHGARVTVVTTPANAAHLSPHHPGVAISLIPFPSAFPDLLPSGVENVAAVTSEAMKPAFFRSIPLLQPSFHRLLDHLRPHCLISDSFLPWTLDVASTVGVPRLFFRGTGFFSHCLLDIVHRHNLRETLCSADADGGSDALVIPGLPDRIEMLKSRLPSLDNPNVDRIQFFRRAWETDAASYGGVVNSFYELEPAYVDHYRRALGYRAWHVGPISLWNKDHNSNHKELKKNGNFNGFDGSSINGDFDCLKWLENRATGSVIYVCFGSLSGFSNGQLREIAKGLIDSKHCFIWVAKRDAGEGGGGGGESDWLPEECRDERIKEKGLVIRGWAPQVVILNHAAVGGFVTHCGWNSTLEGVMAGVPMATWPLFADQFSNERLVVDVLKIGVEVRGRGRVTGEAKDLVPAEEVAKAVGRVMGGGEEAEEMRRKAKELAQMANKAMEEGGSSYVEIGSMMKELKNLKNNAADQQ